MQTWGRRFNGRAGCTSLRRAVESPQTGPVSGGITHVGPALRLPHHAAGNLPRLGVDDRAASEERAMAPLLSNPGLRVHMAERRRPASQISTESVRLFAPTKGVIIAGRQTMTVRRRGVR